MLKIIPIVLALFLFLLSTPATAQNFTTTSGSLTYTYLNGSADVLMEAEWLYSQSQPGSFQAWSVSFDLTVRRYYTMSDLLAGTNIISNTTTTYTCNTGEYSVGLYAPGVIRVYGLKTAVLTQGFVYKLTMVPKATFGWRLYYYQSYQSYSWNGQTKELNVDLLNPGDG
jgi:hypothetical protein